MAALYAAQGIRSEERAAMLVLDQIEFPIIFWGSLKAGIVPIAVNTLLATDVYDTILRDSHAAYCLYRRPCCQLCNRFWKTTRICGPFSSLATAANIWISTLNWHGVKPDQLCQPIRTPVHSGSIPRAQRGQPKGVRHIHSSLKFTADTYGEQGAADQGR